MRVAADLPWPVAPGSGWPDDPASPDTPVAEAAGDVPAVAAGAPTLAALDARVSVCRACPRLVAWREDVAATKRRAFEDETYWGRPIAGWGDPHPRVLVAGLAPAAHGGNRTGRIFTGDRSGDWLFASLYRVGLAASPTSTVAGDGQRLLGARMAAAVRCAPPQNKPTPVERDTCAPWFREELRRVLPDLRAVVTLGSFAWQATWGALRDVGLAVPRPRPRFGHAAEVALDRATTAARPEVTPADGDAAAARDPGPLLVLGCYHPSQQNTFTGRVTEAMLDAVLGRAAAYAGL